MSQNFIAVHGVSPLMSHRNFGRTLAAVAALAVIPLPARADERQPQIPDLKVETYTLPNGLQVILHEDHTTPVVGVNLWYRVGSKNEKEGRTGFAHLFEHLMFQGSKHHDNEYFGPLESSAQRSTAAPARTAPTTSRPSRATPWSWRSGSKPTGWAS